MWRLDAVPRWSLDEHLPRAHPLVPDEAGELRLAFDDLQQRHGYGLMWD